MEVIGLWVPDDASSTDRSELLQNANCQAVSFGGGGIVLAAASQLRELRQAGLEQELLPPSPSTILSHQIEKIQSGSDTQVHADVTRVSRIQNGHGHMVIWKGSLKGIKVNAHLPFSRCAETTPSLPRNSHAEIRYG